MEGSADQSPLSIPFSLVNLREAEQRVLSYASAMGKEFHFDVLWQVLEMEEEPLAEVLEDLVHRGVLREHEGGDVYEFLRAETQSQAYHSISSSRMRVIHRRIAEAYARAYAKDPPPELIPEIGRHFHLGKVYEQSVMYNRYSATLARESFSPETALVYLGRVDEAFRNLPGDHAREHAEVLREMGDLYFDTGDATRADEIYQKAIEKLPATEKTLRAFLLLSRADAAMELYRRNTARICCDEALQLLAVVGHRRGLALAHRISSRIYFQEDEAGHARRETEAALALFDPATDGKDIARCYIELANAYSEMMTAADQRRAIEFYQKAISGLEALKDYRDLFRAHNNLGVAVGTDYPEEALRQFAAAKECAEKLKNQRDIGWSLFNSVEFLVMLGRLDEAEASNAEAEKILSRLDDPLGMQQIALNRGILAQQRQRYVEAESAYRDALVRAENFRRPPLMAEMHLRLAWLYEEWKRPMDRNREMWEIVSLGEQSIMPNLRPMYDRLHARIRQPA